MPQKKPLAEHPVFKAVLLFFIALIVSVILWLKVKDHYCYMITFAASKVFAMIEGFALEEFEVRGDAFYLSLNFIKGSKKVSLVSLLSSNISRYYVFNVPLTLSLLVSLSWFIKKRKRAFTEALAMLLLSHFIYVFCAEAAIIKEQTMLSGIEPVNTSRLSVYQYLWKVTEFIVMAFGPFLIAAYVFVRYALSLNSKARPRP